MSALGDVGRALLELEVVHRTTGETRKLAVFQAYPREIALRWPLYGVMRFHNRLGTGIGPAKEWSIVHDDLKRLHTELRTVGIFLGPVEESVDGQLDIKKTR